MTHETCKYGCYPGCDNDDYPEPSDYSFKQLDLNVSIVPTSVTTGCILYDEDSF